MEDRYFRKPSSIDFSLDRQSIDSMMAYVSDFEPQYIEEGRLSRDIIDDEWYWHYLP